MFKGNKKQLFVLEKIRRLQMDTLAKIKELIANQLNIAIETVTDEKEIVRDLGADSLDIVEMVMSIEEEFGIQVDDDKMSDIKTVGDIAKLVEEN